MNDCIRELFRFFDSENVKYFFDDTYEDTLHFRSYGESYTIMCNENDTFLFCCKSYENVNLLIDAISKKCRGGDGKLV